MSQLWMENRFDGSWKFLILLSYTYRNKMEVNIIKLRKESERERRVIKFDKLTVIIRGMS